MVRTTTDDATDESNDEPRDDFAGTRVRLCHKVLRVDAVNADSYTLIGELGGVRGNTVVVTPEYAHSHVVGDGGSDV